MISKRIHKYTLSFQCLGFKPIGLVLVNLHSTNGAIKALQGQKQTKESKRQRGGRAESAPGTVGFHLLTQSVSGDGGQGQRVVAHRLILDYLQIKAANETNEAIFPEDPCASNVSITSSLCARGINQRGFDHLNRD